MAGLGAQVWPVDDIWPTKDEDERPVLILLTKCRDPSWFLFYFYFKLFGSFESYGGERDTSRNISGRGGGVSGLGVLVGL